MNPWVLVALLLLAFSLAGAAGIRSTTSGKGSPVSAARIKAMSRREISRMLERVAREDEPEFVMGAMCYAVMAMPEVAEYVCPVCGEKTVYGAGQAATIQWELSTARAMVESIRSVTDLDAMLDESSFCSFCGPDSVTPGMRLVVTYQDGSVNTAEIRIDDLRMLSGLLSGELYYLTSNDSRSPLGPNLDRLASILGVEAPTE